VEGGGLDGEHDLAGCAELRLRRQVDADDLGAFALER
jgi:hypothetical protein